MRLKIIFGQESKTEGLNWMAKLSELLVMEIQEKV